LHARVRNLYKFIPLKWNATASCNEFSVSGCLLPARVLETGNRVLEAALPGCVFEEGKA